MKKTAVIAGAVFAVIAIPVFCSSAFAQTQVVTDGHAADANTRIGSGAQNVGSTSQSNQSIGNQIVTGNVTGFSAFHGADVRGINVPVNYSDSSAFGGIQPGAGIDQFVAESTGVPTLANRQLSTQTFTQGTQPYYGVTQTASTPAGYTLQPANNTLVPVNNSVTVQPYDTRLGSVGYSTPVQLPTPGDMFLPGPVDTSANDTIFAASPLYGVQTFNSDDQQNVIGNTNLNGSAGTGTPNVAMTQQQIMQAQQQNANQDQNQNLNGQTYLNSPNGVNDKTSRALTPLAPNGTPGATKVTAQQPPAANQILNTSISPTVGDLSTGQSVRRYLPPLDVNATQQQSATYQQLRQRLDLYRNTSGQSDEQANRDFISALRIQRALQNGGKTTGGTTSGTAANGTSPNTGSPDNGTTPSGQTGTTPTPDNNGGANPTGQSGTDMNTPVLTPNSGGPAAQEPVQINSLSSAVKSKNLADMLKDGESQVKQEQYDKAISTFNAAQQVEPTNSIVLLGRAEAELGAGYYQNAEADLRTAFKQDNAVVMGQYDLTKNLGDKRVDFIKSDLQRISTDLPHNPTPLFLLAYVNYNTHHEDEAAKWLNALDDQTGGTDDAVPMLRKYWNLKAPSSDDLNK